MTDLISFAETTARDPLVGAFAFMAVGVLVSRLLLKQQPNWRAIARVVFLVLLTLLLLHGGIVPYQSLQPEEIVAKLRQVDVLVSHGQNMADAIRQIGVSEVTFYRMPPTGEDMVVTVIVARQAPDPANLYLLL